MGVVPRWEFKSLMMRSDVSEATDPADMHSSSYMGLYRQLRLYRGSAQDAVYQAYRQLRLHRGSAQDADVPTRDPSDMRIRIIIHGGDVPRWEFRAVMMPSDVSEATHPADMHASSYMGVYRVYRQLRLYRGSAQDAAYQTYRQLRMYRGSAQDADVPTRDPADMRIITHGGGCT